MGGQSMRDKGMLAKWLAVGGLGIFIAIWGVGGCGAFSDGDGAYDQESGGWAGGDADADGDAAPDWDPGETPAESVTPFEDEIDPEEADEPVCDVDNEVVLYLSADDSNSMAGPTVARGIIEQGQIVYKALRTYEFLNYYDFDYPPAEADSVALYLAMREDESGIYNLQLGVQAPTIEPEDRRPVNLTIAVDSSSSMGWGTRGQLGIDRARAACRALASALRDGDVVSLVTWGGEPRNVLSAVSVEGPDDARLLARCDELEPYGTTNFHDGLVASYELAEASFDDSLINRVVLISDGGANIGTTDEELIAAQADDADGEAIYLLGVGVGDAWNYNDRLMNAVTDAGKGAYVFLDDSLEAERALGEGFVRHVEVAARNVQVELTLPPSFQMLEFHGEEYSSDPEEVEPQHLAMDDAMVFHQIVESCAPETLSGESSIQVTARFVHPITREESEVTVTSTFGELLAMDDPMLRKGDAIVAYAEALKEIRDLEGADAVARIDRALAEIEVARAVIPEDEDVAEIVTLLGRYRRTFEDGQIDAYPAGGAGDDPMRPDCSECDSSGSSLEALRCAVGLCDDDVFITQEYSSPTDSPTGSTYATSSRFGSAGNDLAPREGERYALMATGPATGRQHSIDVGGRSEADPFSRWEEPMYNAMEWRLTLRAPEGANGLRINHMFFSEEYDDFIGTAFNDKFYVVIEAGSTNGGTPTVINYTECRDPELYHDFVCSPGMQFCNPRQRYCYIAINTAASECCWFNGCPDGRGTTDISGTGFECADESYDDSDHAGSTTGWMITEWPIEPGETFDLVFHVHDTGDGIYDSEVIIDAIQFLENVTPGTWRDSTPI